MIDSLELLNLGASSFRTTIALLPRRPKIIGLALDGSNLSPSIRSSLEFFWSEARNTAPYLATMLPTPPSPMILTEQFFVSLGLSNLFFMVSFHFGPVLDELGGLFLAFQVGHQFGGRE